MALQRPRKHVSLAEDGLVKALDEYEQILNEQEKRNFRAEGRPSAKAAIELTVLVDKRCNEGRRQCIGQRLHAFLESIQQFSEAADTLVSSHPEVAALVWGGVKLTILAANATSYFDKLATLLMNLGRRCPRVYEFGNLYSTSGLREALCEFSAAVVRLCRRIMESLKMPVYLQIPKAFFISFEADFKKHEEEIRILSEAVRDEAQIASEQARKKEVALATQERHKNSISRNLLRMVNDSQSHMSLESKAQHLEIQRWLAESRKTKTLDLISTYDHRAAYRHIRRECVPGTAEWIVEDKSFKDWMNGSTRTLCMTGKLGSGKSVVSARVVDQLIERLTPTDSLAFFFCRFDDEESLQSKTIIGSIIRQLICAMPATRFQLLKNDNLSKDAMTDFVKSFLDDNHRYFVLLDGIDECDKHHAKKVTEMLDDLLGFKYLDFKFFISHRPSLPTWLSNKFVNPLYISLENTQVRQKVDIDIQKFISVNMADYIIGEEPELKLGDPRLATEIQNTLEREACGMFLWVKLQLLTLLEQNSDEQILTALHELPKDLPETFDRLLSRHVRQGGQDSTRRIFDWVAAAKRPLTLGEIREAISIAVLQEDWEPQRLVNDVQKAIAHCGNLIFVDVESCTLHFTHGSVKQHLTSGTIGKSGGKYSVDLQKAELMAGALCVTYLNFPEFNRQLTRPHRRTVQTAGIASTVVKNSLSSGAVSSAIVSRLSRHSSASEIPVNQLYELAKKGKLNSDASEFQQKYAFLQYAQMYWLHHTKGSMREDDQKVHYLWCKLVQEAGSRDILAGVPWTIRNFFDCSPALVDWIIDQDHYRLAEMIFDSPASHKFEPLIQAAARSNRIAMFVRGLNAMQIEDHALLNGCLRDAAAEGHLQVVERLLESGVDVNVVDRAGWTVLMRASDRGHIKVVDKLLQVGASTQLSGEEDSWTALYLASSSGHATVVDHLLRAGADVNFRTRSDTTALSIASGNGHLEVIERLLLANADVDRKNESGNTALFQACNFGHLEVVDRLIQAGAKVNETDRRSSSVLHGASRKGYLGIADSLLLAQAEVNATDSKGCTPLHEASEKGHLTVVEKLLEARANVSVINSKGWTALDAAQQGGYLEIAERLMRAKSELAHNGKEPAEQSRICLPSKGE